MINVIPVNLRAARIRYIVYRIFKKKLFRFYIHPTYRLIRYLGERLGIFHYLYPWVSGQPFKSPKIIHQGKHVLLLRPDHIGDLVYSLPSILLIKESLEPQDRLSILIDPCNSALAQHLELFNNIYVFPIFNQAGNRSLPSISEYQQLQNTLGHVDVLIDLRPDGDSFFLIEWINSDVVYRIHNQHRFIHKQLVSKMSQGLFENPQKPQEFWFCSKALKDSRPRLVFDFALATMNHLGKLNLMDLNRAIQASQKLLQKHFPLKLKDDIVFCPEARVQEKVWATENSHMLIDYLVNQKHPFKIIGQKAFPYFENFPSNRDLRTRTDIIEAMENIAQAKIYIGFDSGLAHFSCLIGTPTICIFTGRTDPRVWAGIPSADNLVIIKPNFSLPKRKLSRLLQRLFNPSQHQNVTAQHVISLLKTNYV